MKKSTHRIATALFALSLTTVASLHAAGSLTPPGGAPTAVMKTLNEVEPRIPLVAGSPGVSVDGVTGAIIISQRGSYYLTGNVTITTVGATAIHIGASQVTLDLNGFSLICTGVNGGSAITLLNSNGSHVHNGHIVGGTTLSGSVFTLAGWDKGINIFSSSSVLVSDISVTGTRSSGIDLAASSLNNVVERCRVDICGGIGIVAPVVRDCSSINTSSDGIYVGPFGGISVTNSFGRSAGTGYGIDATGATVTNCRGISVSSFGLFAEMATHCYGQTTSGANGLQVASTASFCRGKRDGGVAILAPIAIGCSVSGTGTVSSAQKHLGTP